MKKTIAVLLSIITVFSFNIKFGSKALAAGEEKIVAKGIDVSYWQGNNINWQSLKDEGVNFVIMRIGKNSSLDNNFEKNYNDARAVGLNIGGYWYSTATNTDKSKKDAETVLKAIEGKRFEYPIYCDMEDTSSQGNLTTAERTDIALTFVKTLQNAGYFAGVYANLNWFKNYLDSERIKNECETWIAHYISLEEDQTIGFNEKADLKDYSNFGMYQYTSRGKMAGITENTVDLNVAYKNYPELIINGGYSGYPKINVNTNAPTLFNANKKWYYVVNKMVDYNATTLCNYYGTWYYVKNGVVDFSANTLCKYGNTWYYVKNGRVDFNATTLCKYYDTWYYVKKGVVDFGATTLCNYYGTWYYVKNGRVDFNATTLCNYYGTWYYVKKGAVDFGATTLCNYYGTWYYVKKGAVDFKATTLCKYYDTWYYVKNGRVDFNATTLCKYGKTWYYVNKGKVDFKANLKYNYFGKVYKIKNGIVIL